MKGDVSQPRTLLHDDYVLLMVKLIQETAVTDIVLMPRNIPLC